MARTPLANVVQAAAAELPTTRRRFVAQAGAAALGLTALGRLTAPARSATAPKIIVVGAGLAGLSAAYALRNAGYLAEVHEASSRIGGRCWTLRGAFADGQIVEHGGELIDQSHSHIRNLAQQLGLKLDNLLQAEQNGTELIGYFDRAPYRFAEITDDIKAAWQKIHADVSAASYPTTFEISTERGRELDNMSIVDWIEETFEGGMSSRIGQLLDIAYNIEYGAESSE
jgi:monoamine oxidase